MDIVESYMHMHGGKLHYKQLHTIPADLETFGHNKVNVHIPTDIITCTAYSELGNRQVYRQTWGGQRHCCQYKPTPLNVLGEEKACRVHVSCRPTDALTTKVLRLHGRMEACTFRPLCEADVYLTNACEMGNDSQSGL